MAGKNGDKVKANISMLCVYLNTGVSELKRMEKDARTELKAWLQHGLDNGYVRVEECEKPKSVV